MISEVPFYLVDGDVRGVPRRQRADGVAKGVNLRGVEVAHAEGTDDTRCLELLESTPPEKRGHGRSRKVMEGHGRHPLL